MADSRQTKQTEALPWKDQLRSDSIRKANKQYPYIIPESVDSKNPEAVKLWDNLKSYIAKTYGEPTMVAWFEPCRIRGLIDKRFAIWTPYQNSTFWKDYMESTFEFAIESFRKFHKLDEVLLFPYISNAIEPTRR